MMNKKSIILFFIVFSIIICGTDGTIRGQVADDDGSPLIGAQIYIPQLGKGTAADVDGNYIMINIVNHAKIIVILYLIVLCFILI